VRRRGAAGRAAAGAAGRARFARGACASLRLRGEGGACFAGRFLLFLLAAEKGLTEGVELTGEGRERLKGGVARLG